MKLIDLVRVGDRERRLRPFARVLAVMIALTGFANASAAPHGRVTDLNGAPLAQALVTLTKSARAAGATATTVFTDSAGEFSFPANTPPGTLQVRLLNYRQIGGTVPVGPGAQTLLMRPEANQAGTAPASAYLKDMKNPAHREALVMNCVGCHQLPAPEVRAYAKLLDDTPSTQTAEARELAWTAIVKQMNYVSNVEFGRAGNLVLAGENVYSGGAPGPTAKILTEALRGPLLEVRGYSYGAPLIVTPRTTIREFEVAAPNAVREAVPFQGTGYLYAADVSANRLIRIDTRSGATKDFPIPGKELWGPHTLVPGADGIWVSAFFPGAVLRYDPRGEHWKLWRLNQPGGPPVGLHDMSFDADHELVTDHHGRLWFSDIVNNAVGWLDPATGKSGEFKIPPVAGRAAANKSTAWP